MMSDIETPTPPPEPAPPEPVVDPSVARIAELEQQVAELTAQLDQAKNTPPPEPVSFPPGVAVSSPARAMSVSSSAFDADARASELVRQGLSEQDAVEQAAYEERLWNDRNKPAG